MFLSYKGAGNDNTNTELEAFLGKEFSVEQFLREEKEGSQTVKVKVKAVDMRV